MKEYLQLFRGSAFTGAFGLYKRILLSNIIMNVLIFLVSGAILLPLIYFIASWNYFLQKPALSLWLIFYIFYLWCTLLLMSPYLPLVRHWLFCHSFKYNRCNVPPNGILAMDTPFPIWCTNCHDKQLQCKASPHTKGSCHHCLVNGGHCLFPPLTTILNGSPHSDTSPYQRNCTHCTQSHQKCNFHCGFPIQCTRCIKFDLPCLFKLSSQGCRNIWRHQILPR